MRPPEAKSGVSAAILAAGVGSRIDATADCPKPLLMLLGRPLIDRLLDILAGVGIEVVAIAIRSTHQTLAQHLSKRARPPRVHLMVADTSGGKESLLALRPVLTSSFLLCTADSIFPPGELRELVGSARADETAAMTMAVVPRAFQPGGDVGAVVEDGFIVDLGKGLKQTKWVAEGPVWCSESIFDADAIGDVQHLTSLSEYYRALVHRGYPVRAYAMSWALDIDTKGDLIRAKEWLRELDRRREPKNW